jgi:hypothetical protein
MRCSGCGGTLGRDCFNEAECVEISRQRESDYREMEGLWNQISELQYKVDLLEEALYQNDIPLPYEKPTVPLPSDDDEDLWLPF